MACDKIALYRFNAREADLKWGLGTPPRQPAHGWLSSSPGSPDRPGRGELDRAVAAELGPPRQRYVHRLAPC